MKADLSNPAFWDIVQTSQNLRSREITAVQLTEHLLERIKRTDRRFAAFTTVTQEHALERVRIAEQEILEGRWKGPLHGVPIGIKDIIDTTFAPTTAGSALFAGFIPARNATVVERLESAGAIVVGKVKTTEGAWTGYAENDIAPLNAWNENYWSGASSSGSAVAVAAGLCHAALASDTGGSIRVPCWCNGATGFKPSWGAVSRAGVFALAPSLDTVGVVARSARDASIVFDAIAGIDPADPTTWEVCARSEQDSGPIKIGIDPLYCFDGVDPQVVAAIEEAIEIFEALGVKKQFVKFPDAPDNHRSWHSILQAEVLDVHRDHYPARAQEYGPALRSLLEESGRAVDRTDVVKAMQHRDVLRRLLDGMFRTIDVFVTPVAPMLVPSPDGWLAQDSRSERFLGLVNLGGLPSLTLPVGIDDRGLPLVMQIIGPVGSDRLVLALGERLQAVTSYHKRMPPS